MSYILPNEKQAAVIGALAEGNSIRSIERLESCLPITAVWLERRSF